MTARNPLKRPRAGRVVAAAVLLAAGWSGMPVAAAAAPIADPGQGDAGTGTERQVALVAAEDRRLIQVRGVAATAPWSGMDWSKPYRLDTGNGHTLVLTPRSADYTIADLLKLAPQTFVRQADGSYLLTENLYVDVGAKLVLSDPGGLRLRLASSADKFVSIVSFGGRLALQGTAEAPTVVTSWDPGVQQPDTDVNDGRSYLRAVGGEFSMTYAKISDLGFWSGRTGGLSLTGTDRPNTDSVNGPAPVSKTQRRRPEAGRPGQPGVPVVTPDSRFTTQGDSYVTGKISQSVISGNAFGLFVTSAKGISISDTTVENSRVDGVVMHRFASGVTIERTTSRHNSRDGFVLSRATREIRISGSTAAGNGGNGFTLSGEPLAVGPSASGESTTSYGSNSVSKSIVRDNSRYGIEVIGGLDVDVQNNEVVGGVMGIVARQAAEDVAITGNQLRGQRRQGIAVRDGVTSAVVTGNYVEKTGTGIYVRDSSAEVRRNTVKQATSHGVTVVGRVGSSAVSHNVIGGDGPSAIDIVRAGVKVPVEQNQTAGWHDTRPFWVKIWHSVSPITMLWAGLLLLVAFSSVLGRRRISDVLLDRSVLHPYADKVPLGNPPPVELGIVRIAAPVRVVARARVMSR
jgi:hypothetical protein